MVTVTSRDTIAARRHRTERIALAVLVVAAALLAWNWRSLNANARIAAAFGARIGCSCRFVARRPLADCRADFEPRMGLVVLSEDAAAKSVTARFPLLAAQTARWRAGQGCRLDRWDQPAGLVAAIQPPPTTRSPA